MLDKNRFEKTKTVRTKELTAKIRLKEKANGTAISVGQEHFKFEYGSTSSLPSQLPDNK